MRLSSGYIELYRRNLPEGSISYDILISNHLSSSSVRSCGCFCRSCCCFPSPYSYRDIVIPGASVRHIDTLKHWEHRRGRRKLVRNPQRIDNLCWYRSRDNRAFDTIIDSGSNNAIPGSSQIKLVFSAILYDRSSINRAF